MENIRDKTDTIMQQAWSAFHIYRKTSLKQRADFMRSIASELEACGDALINTAMQETHLAEARLRAERTRTAFQLNNYADFCESGQWLDARIDTSDANRTPPKPDIRKLLIPLGPVVVFGASNFPFAYSTAGGDTASAFAAGCPVIVKAHPAHPLTSNAVAEAIFKAASNCKMPAGIFAHVHGENDMGEALVKHPHTKAVGFTGSFAGGKQLFDWGSQRKEPIPVFAEMGSVNPVFLLQGKMADDAMAIAKMYAASITLGVGQFCTNPGIIVGIDDAALDTFCEVLSAEIKMIQPAAMLHEGIAKSYAEKRTNALSQRGVSQLAVAEKQPDANAGNATIAETKAKHFIQNHTLQQEVFGPYSLLVKCKDVNEMLQVAKILDGQLTATLMGTEKDIMDNEELVEALKDICGRLILNSVPTGVEVCLAMHHGGPFPACTDSRFTSVGADAIKRFARPIAFQNWPDNLLPNELKNSNPLNIWRTVNNTFQQDKML